MTTHQPIDEPKHTFSFAAFLQQAFGTLSLAAVLACFWVLLAAKPAQ